MSRKISSVTTLFGDGEFRQVRHELSFHESDDSVEGRVVSIFPEITYQEFHGFGGAITEAAGSVLNQLSPEDADDIISSYFGPNGLGYTWVRTHIDSCDFSLGTYSSLSLDEERVSIDSSVFDQHDGRYILPYLEKARQLLQEQGKGPVRLYLTPWSPPAFMKSNGKRDGGGRLLPEHSDAWAQYLCQYVEKYEDMGFPVAVLGVQNESNAVQTWDSCCYTPAEEHDFIRDKLYPRTIDHNLEYVKIAVWDHNRDELFARVQEVYSDDVRDMVGAAAFHWYGGDHFEGLRMTHEQYPELLLVFSEGCIEYSRLDHGSQLEHAQRYAHNIIGDLNNGMHAWIDWNIVLNYQGGPNHVQNLCDAPIMGDPATGAYRKNLSYHYIGHFSRYIKPGAVRIGLSRFTNDLEITTWKNTDGTCVMVVLNMQDADISFHLKQGGAVVGLTAAAQSIMTVEF